MFGATWARLVVGSVLLLAIAATAVSATSPAFAFSIKSDLPNVVNAGSPSNATGSLSRLELYPGATMSFTARYSFASYTAAAQGHPGAANMEDATVIKTLWQQWRHEQQNNWFYLYAQNTASATAPAVWNFYYYTREHGGQRIATAVDDGDTAEELDPRTIGIPGENDEDVPLFSVQSMTADVNPEDGSPNCNPGFDPTEQCSAQFTAVLTWGLAQGGFRPGSMILTQAVETFAIRNATILEPRVYYDAWESPLRNADARIRLRNNAPTQSRTGVTNASGARTANLRVPYTMTQTVADVDGDLNAAQLIWIQTSGPDVGTWFTAGVVVESADEGLENPGSPASAFYESWNEERLDFATGAPETTAKFGAISITATPTTAVIGGATGARSLAVTYSFIYATAAQGTWTVFGRAEDWHGGTSGNVPTGSQTISTGR